ncbi:MAG: methylphosphotriester-DNA--protein-cysteine methyltransferase family protein [Ignavibacteriales bacterium]|nr:methylphosphotriester-DNA--protein-cysteine methyltransferase family protein [Ignavibacteriales bacterium]
MEKITYDKMVAAMLTDDAAYDGKFYVCVKTTGIYCIPSCKAKTPMLKNVVFLRTRKEAVAKGFRGCKRCRSEFFPDVQPCWWNKALDLMKTEITRKITEDDLARIAKIDISTIRRYFKAYMETTPMAFHRKLRLEHARTLIEKGNNYLTTAYECGFESASGFRDAFIKQYGYTPGKSNGRKNSL